MTPVTTSAFDLPDRLAAKAEPALIARDEKHFAAIAESLEQSYAELTGRLDAERKAPGGVGQQAMDRDLEIHRLTARLRTLRRFGLDLCLGHMVGADDEEPVYVGRLGLTDSAGRRLLLDWRSAAAEPFFGATHANPMGLASRRRYRWTNGRVTDYWDEVFTADGFAGHAAALDDQSAFIASLGGNRSARMRDVLGTIQADQDAIIRAGSGGALVVDGGPGTGKTVVALHRTAYLLYADPRLGHRRGGVLFVGPHQPYLSYVADVLPSLGEEGVQICTLRDFLPEGAAAVGETDPEVARLKSSVELVRAIETAVRFYEEPPAKPMAVATDETDIWLSADDWAEAFEAAEPGIAHNEARDLVWEELLTILVDKYTGDEPDELVRRSLLRNTELLTTFNRAWPLLDAPDLVGDLWSVPAYLRKCAPGLNSEEVRKLQRTDPQLWTVSDLPLLDAARQRLGDPEASRRERQHKAALAAERARMATVVDDLLVAEDSREPMVNLQRDIQAAVVDETAPPGAEPDRLAGPFAHIVVDEAQELTDAEWQMLLLRCPSKSFTIVGDRAQARHGFTESWQERLERVGLDRITMASLSINYRTPQEIMAEAEPVIRAVLPDANVPTSIRSGGVPVVHGSVVELSAILTAWLDAHTEGIACVIGDPGFRATARVRSLTPELAKGLEFDLVVLVDPANFGDGIEGAVDRYVAMTRATQQLVILTSADAEVLPGGNVADEVVRIGATVRKPVLASTPGVEALLRHLAEVGFDGAPRTLGRDAEGRQILEYIPGSMADTLPPMTPDELGRLGRLIRALHDAAQGFEPPPGAEWDVVIPPDRDEMICHHDLAPWNLVRDGDRWVFIDWDGAGPGSRLWDLAYAAHGFVPMVAGGDPAVDGPRLRALVDGYGLDDAERRALPALIGAHTRGMYELLRSSSLTGRQPWARLWAEGHGDHWGPAADYIDQHLDDWTAALRALPLSP